MNEIIQDLLASMDSAVCNIQQDAMNKGFKGDENDAAAVLSFLGNCPMDVESYGYLYANSAEIAMGYMLIMRHTSDIEAQRKALSLKAFDYNA